MSLSSEHGTSSGDLNTGGNLSESSFLEALFGLEFGHANFADDADFSSLMFVSPTDFTDFHRFLPYTGLDFADDADDANFSCSSSITHHDLLEEDNNERFCGILLVTCRFLAIFLVVSRKKRNFGGKS